MIKRLRKTQRLQSTLLLLGMTLFCALLWLVRRDLSDSGTYRFLNWNLFLAFVPWLISSMLLVLEVKNKVLLSVFLVSWLLFFPNAPYILTDLVHLRDRDPIPFWFDMILILSYAWTGLMFGMMSLIDIHKVVKKYLGNIKSNVMVFGVLFLSAYGIYLGRFLRWNTWDVLSNPIGLLKDIALPFFSPIEHKSTWVVTLLMGILLNMIYFSIRMVKNEHKKSVSL